MLADKDPSWKDLRSEAPGVGLVKTAESSTAEARLTEDGREKLEAGLQPGAGPEQTAGKGSAGSRAGPEPGRDQELRPGSRRKGLGRIQTPLRRRSSSSP